MHRVTPCANCRILQTTPCDRMAIVYGLSRVANISWKIRLAALVVVSVASPAFPATPGISFDADESVHVGPLSSEIDLLEDKSAELDIEAVSHAPANTGFVAATPKSTNIGFSASAWWVRLTLHNTSGQPR